MCRAAVTLLIGLETVYALRDGTDRLFLGLKVSLNECDLGLLCQRSLAVCHERARQVMLVVSAPVGFVKGGDRSYRYGY